MNVLFSYLARVQLISENAVESFDERLQTTADGGGSPSSMPVMRNEGDVMEVGSDETRVVNIVDIINKILESEFKFTLNICNAGTSLISASANLPVGRHLNGHVVTNPQALSKSTEATEKPLLNGLYIKINCMYVYICIHVYVYICMYYLLTLYCQIGDDSDQVPPIFSVLCDGDL